MLQSVILGVLMDREAREEEAYFSLLARQQNIPAAAHSWRNPYHNTSESSFTSHHGYQFGRNRSSQKSIPKYGSVTGITT